MKEFYTAKELAGVVGMPGTERSVQRIATRENWQFQTRTGKGGGREYALTALPEETRLALAGNSIVMPAGMPVSLGLEIARRHATEKEATRIAGEKKLTEFSELSKEMQELAHARREVLTACEVFLKTAQARNKRSGMARFCSYWAEVQGNSGDTIRNQKDDSGHVPFNSGHVPGISLTVSVSSLFRWFRLYDEFGLSGLANHHHNPRKDSTSLTQEHQDFCVALIYKKPHSSYTLLNMALEARFESPPGSHSVRRFVNKWKKQNAALLLFVTNPDAYRNEKMVAFGDASEQVERLNQVWEFDSTPADVMLVDGRHCLIGCIDVFTRRLKLLVSKTSRATAVAALTRAAIIDWGVPEIAKTDNGADYVSKHMVWVFSALGVEQKLCPPFTPQAKPHIERAFGTFTRAFQEAMPGYIGHSVADRKAIENRRSFAERLGDRDGVVEINMTAAELQSYCDRWVNAIYHQTPHSGLNGKTPAAVALAWNEQVRRIVNVRALDILLSEAPDNDGVRDVGKKGVRVGNIHYISESLPEVGTKVRVRLDTHDLGTIYLFDEDGNFLCVAQDPVRTGIDRAEIAAKAKNLQKKYIAEGAKELKKMAKAQAVDDIHEEILQAAEARIAKIIELPKPSVEHVTGALVEAGKAVVARDERQAEDDGYDVELGVQVRGQIEPPPTPSLAKETPAPVKEKVVLLWTDAETYEQIRNRVRTAKLPLKAWEDEFLATFYSTPMGVMWKKIDGNFREKFGTEDDVIEVES